MPVNTIVRRQRQHKFKAKPGYAARPASHRPTNTHTGKKAFEKYLWL